ncbi:MAG: hypothetical protein ACK481_04135 [Candidatus Melainabacteria bacterium]|jgi:hypothetical protein
MEINKSNSEDINSELQKYEMKICFGADEKNKQAFYDALAQVCEAWNRHKRILNPAVIIELIK